MGWDSGYKSLEEREAEQDAAREAQQRAKLSQFERRLLDTLGGILNQLGRIAAAMDPVVDAELVDLCPNAHTEFGDCDRDVNHVGQCGNENGTWWPFGSGGVTGEGDVASAEPVDRAGPGSARPDLQDRIEHHQRPHIHTAFLPPTQ